MHNHFHHVTCLLFCLSHALTGGGIAGYMIVLLVDVSVLLACIIVAAFRKVELESLRAQWKAASEFEHSSILGMTSQLSSTV